jgi:hypothetical protein
MGNSYLRLDPNQIVETVETLSKRIHERFPEANLNRVCESLLEIAKQAQSRSTNIGRPMLGLRLITLLFIAAVVSVFRFVYGQFRLEDTDPSLEELLQMCDAGFQTLVLIGATIVFLLTLESRVKRRRCLKAIHELRSIAHIIDMHQLTKDPDRLILPGPNTKSSPKRSMSAFELTRYLDYCIEMLSLSGKIAALYIQRFEDPEAVSAVNDLEDLTSGLSRKIWQKIMVLPSVVVELSKHGVDGTVKIAADGPRETTSVQASASPDKPSQALDPKA